MSSIWHLLAKANINTNVEGRFFGGTLFWELCQKNGTNGWMLDMAGATLKLLQQ
jgi:hypothetical protein